VEKYGTARHVEDGNIVGRIPLACCINKATDAYSECVILIAFPQQKWSRESAWMLRS